MRDLVREGKKYTDPWTRLEENVVPVSRQMPRTLRRVK